VREKEMRDPHLQPIQGSCWVGATPFPRGVLMHAPPIPPLVSRSRPACLPCCDFTPPDLVAPSTIHGLLDLKLLC
jgi:hypothetical protein